METPKTEGKETLYNYYDHAPEHNEQINAYGLGNLLRIIITIVCAGLGLLAYHFFK